MVNLNPRSVRAWMALREKTQADILKETSLDVSPGTLSNWLRGARCGDDEAKSIAQALGVSLAKLCQEPSGVVYS